MIDFNLLLRRETFMSEIVFIKQNDNVVLTSDSLITNLAYNKAVKEKYFTGKTTFLLKVFYNKERKIIWSICGDMSLCENIKNCLNKCLINSHESFSTEMRTMYKAIIEYYKKEAVNDNMVNCHLFIIININNQLYCLSIFVSSVPGENDIVYFDTGRTLTLLAGTYINKEFNIDICNSKYVNAIDESCDIIKMISDYDSKNPKFGYQSVGGDIYSVSMDKDGNIKTYINNKEKEF